MYEPINKPIQRRMLEIIILGWQKCHYQMTTCGTECLTSIYKMGKHNCKLILWINWVHIHVYRPLFDFSWEQILAKEGCVWITWLLSPPENAAVTAICEVFRNMCDQSKDAEFGRENLARFNETQNKCMNIILIYFSTWNLQQIMFPELIAADLITNSLITPPTPKELN